MKEYKVEMIKPGMTGQKSRDKMESLLNDLASQGWEFKFEVGGLWWIFERDKH
jgi:hypothetical protein